MVHRPNALKPPKNFRPTTPRCCATCKFFEVKDVSVATIWGCKRDEAYHEIFDWVDLDYSNYEQFYHVCDSYQKKPRFGEES